MLAKKKYSKTKISSYINKNIGLSISFIATSNKISEAKIYNFCKGLSRNKTVEEVFLKIGVPIEIIENTFAKAKDE